MSEKVKLTKFSTLRGWGCKVPQDVLKKLLSKVYDDTSEKPADSIGKLDFAKLVENIWEICFISGIGLDSAVVPLRSKNLFLVQSVDFFYPLCDDGKLMGEETKFLIKKFKE